MVVVYTYSEITPVDLAPYGAYESMTSWLDGRYGLFFRAEHVVYPSFEHVTDSVTLQSVDALDGLLQSAIPLPLSGGWAFAFSRAQLSNGDFVQTAGGFGGAAGAFRSVLQVLHPNGTARTAEIAIGADRTGATDHVRAQGLASGGFLVSWSQFDAAHPANGWQDRFQFFDNRGQSTGGPVTNDRPGNQSFPELALLNNGNIVLTSLDDEGSRALLHLQVMARDGTAVSGLVPVDNRDSGYISDPHVVALSLGGFVLQWSTTDLDPLTHLTTRSIVLRVFNADGTARSDRILVEAGASGSGFFDIVQSASLVALPDGRFALGWSHQLPDGAGQPVSQHHLQLFAASGATDSLRYNLGENDGLVSGRDLVALADGRLAASWYHNEALETQIFDSRDHAIRLAGNALGDSYVGTTFNDTIGGVAGNDTIAGWSGADHLYGGRGADRLYGDTGNDRLFGGKGADVIFSGKGNDLITGGAGDDSLNGDLGKDTFVFAPTDGHDQLTGFAHAIDRLDLRAFHFASFDAAASHFATQTDGVLFTLGSDSVSVLGLTMAQLNAADLIL